MTHPLVFPPSPVRAALGAGYLAPLGSVSRWSERSPSGNAMSDGNRPVRTFTLGGVGEQVQSVFLHDSPFLFFSSPRFQAS